MNYMKTAFSFLVAAVFVASAPTSVFALETAAAGTGAETVAPLTTESAGTGAATITAPGTESAGTGAATITVPSTEGAGTGAGSITPPETVGAGTGAGTITPPETVSAGTGANIAEPSVPPVNPPVNNGGQVSENSSTGSNTSVSSGGGSSASGGGSRRNSPVAFPTSCLLTAPLSAGATGTEVIKLQNFLKNTEGINVAATGIFDAQTVAAVKAFQLKYASEILAPWGVTAPTGNVYLTTLKKINSRACNVALTLTPVELAEINAHRARVESGAAVSTEVVGTAVGTETPSSSPSSDTTQVGAAAQTTVAQKIWNFIKRIFGRN